MVHERPRIAEFLSALGTEQASARQLEPQDKVLSKGKEVRVPAETILNFKRNADLHLEATRWYDSTAAFLSRFEVFLSPWICDPGCARCIFHPKNVAHQ